MEYFLGQTYLKTRTPITANVQVEELVPFLATASDMWIQPILGTEYYDYLLLAYNAQTLTPDEETLVNKIKPCVAWRAGADAVIGISLALKNKGVQKQNSDNSVEVDDSTIKFLAAHYTQKAETYESFLIKWLEENKDLYAGFTATSNKNSVIKPQKGDNLNSYFRII